MSYEKDRLDSFVTSASLSSALTTALAPYITSASVSAAIAGISLGAYVTSNSLSAAVATDTLTVRGSAAVSATMSAGAVTVAGRPIATVVLGYQTLDGVTSYSFSGSWSDIYIIDIKASYRMSGTTTASLAIFSDGGVTPFLSFDSNTPVGDTTGFIKFEGTVWGVGNVPQKYSTGTWQITTNAATGDSTYTSTVAVVNCIRITHGRTLSSGAAIAIGYRVL